MDSVRAFCIGHVPPVFQPGLPYTMLTPRPLGLPGEIVLPDERHAAPGLQGAVLAEYSQLFSLQDMIEAGEIQAQRLYLFQYRKFIGLRAGGLPATAPWVRIAPPGEAGAMMPALQELAALPFQVVTGSMFSLGGSVAQNYAHVHVIDDLVAFAACLQAAGLSVQEVRAFAGFQGLLPSPALCLVELPLFLQHMRLLRSVWREYARAAHVPREGYQMRVGGYLLERLHSHLLCRWVQQGGQLGLGHRYVVMDPSGATPAKAPSLAPEPLGEALA